MEPSFQKVARYLVRTDQKRHNRYCPCCKNYDDKDGEATPMQMAEFLEYIRNLHTKLTGKKQGKKERPKD